MLRLIGGCGCLVIVAAAVILAFWFGMEYGRAIKENAIDASENAVRQSRRQAEQIESKFRRTRETVEIIRGKPAPETEKKD